MTKRCYARRPNEVMLEDFELHDTSQKDLEVFEILQGLLGFLQGVFLKREGVCITPPWRFVSNDKAFYDNPSSCPFTMSM